MSMEQKANETPLILVVEDDEATGEVITMAIEQETSYRPRLVTSGQAALQAMQTDREKPGLVILDYRLPDITGIELYDQLQASERTRDIPTLLMSATSRREEIGTHNVPLMEKPFDLDAFIQTIEQLIARVPVTTRPFV